MRPWLLLLPALLSLTSPARSQGCIRPPEGLVVWWDADDTYTAPNGGVWAVNIVDRVGGRPFNWGSAVTSGVGHSGRGFEFTTGNWVQVPDHPEFGFASAMTIELWIRGGTQPASPTFELLNKQSYGDTGFMLYGYPSNGHLVFRIGHGSGQVSFVDSTSVVMNGAWRHVVATFDESLGIQLYVDGQLDGSASTGLPIQLNAMDLTVGKGFVGTMDGISLYDRALNSSEVSELFQAAEKCSERFPARPMPSGQIVSAIPTSYLGGTLAIDGDTLAVSQSGPFVNPYPWGIDIYRRVAGAWTYSERISDAQPPELGAFTISLSGDVLAAGKAGLGAINGGIFIYRFDGTSWSNEMVDLAPLSGNSVAVHGDLAILGRAGEHSCCPGPSFVRIYGYDGTAWSTEAEIPSPYTGWDPRFGISVDIGDDLAVVGAHLADGVDVDAGALYVYRRNAGVWSLAHTITPDMVDPGQASYLNWGFGRQVDLDGERVLVSAPGSISNNLGPGAPVRGTAFVIDLTGGGVFVEGELTPSLLAYSFGHESAPWAGQGRLVHLRGNRAVIGTPGDAGELYSPGGTGAVYVFSRRNGLWGEVGKCMAGIGSQYYLGSSAVLDDDAVITGAAGGTELQLFDGFRHADLPTTYCTSGTTTNGCRAEMTSSGTASVSDGAGFLLITTGLEGGKNGILFYGTSGRSSPPWGGGSTSFLCVKSPTQRTPLQSSGGTSGSCDGGFSLDWNAYFAANPNKAVNQAIIAGSVVNAQAWFRDPPAPRTTNLSNAVEFAVYP